MRVFLVALVACVFASGAKASYLIAPTGESFPQMHRGYARVVHGYGYGYGPVRQMGSNFSAARVGAARFSAARLNTAARFSRVESAGEVVSHPEGCPRSQFCGCGVAVRVFGRPVRDLWLVQNWYRFPRAEAAAGNVAILGSRHVAYILQAYGDGTATLYDPNSGGGLTRVHRVSLRGWAVVDPRATVRRRYQYAQR